MKKIFRLSTIESPDFVSRFASGFNDSLCAILMAQQQKDDVMFHQERDTKQIITLNDLRKECGERVREFINVSGVLMSSLKNA